MADLEESLRIEIAIRYGSVRAFSQLHELQYPKVIHALRRGVHDSNLMIVKSICDALDISLIELAKGNIIWNRKKTPVELDEELLDLYNDLTEEGKEELQDYLDYLLLKHNKYDIHNL